MDKPSYDRRSQTFSTVYIPRLSSNTRRRRNAPTFNDKLELNGKPETNSAVRADQPPGEDEPSDNPLDVQPSDDKPLDDQPSDDKPLDGQPSDDKPLDGQPSDDKPLDGQPSDDKPLDGQPSDDKPLDGQPSDDKPLDGQPSDDKPLDGQPSEPEPIKPSDDQPSEPEPSDILPEEPSAVLPEEAAGVVVSEPEKTETYSEYYIHGYCLRNNNKEQYYARDKQNNELYFVDSVMDQVYAYKTIQVGDSEQRVEYPARFGDGSINYIYERGAPRYPENLTTYDLVFPIDPVTKEEVYLEDKLGRIRYPENRFGKQFYRKDAEGNQVPISYYQYAYDRDGTQIYPKRANQDEFYLKDISGNMESPAKKRKGDQLIQYYAKKANMDEFYPREFVDSYFYKPMPLKEDEK